MAACAFAVLPPGLEALRRLQPDLMHVTLAFLGEVPAARAVAAGDALRAAAARVQPFEAVLAGLGRFPDGGRPHTLWAGLDAGAPEAVALAHRVRDELAARSLPFDPKPPLPHLTLARVSRSADRPALDAISAALRTAVPEGIGFSARTITLFESAPVAGGARYVPRAVAGLGAASPAPPRRRLLRAVEQQLDELAASGALAGVPGEGEPLRLDADDLDDPSWAARHLAVSQRVRPAWVDHWREIEAERERIRRRIAGHRDWLARRALSLRDSPAERMLDVRAATRAADAEFRAGAAADLAALNDAIRRYNRVVPVPSLQRPPLDALAMLGPAAE